ncbi:MAG: TetR/AcrR family transcriptional regulator [Candidatus Eisenbacteria bacterium]|nr:TetR/AcrR family transcriptional regulator [Candidatus Eisenbacteria bacterium]
MPRIVDHEERRAELAAAVWRVIRERGIEHVSLREVAAAAGWSRGKVEHYVRDKDHLLLFAFQLFEQRSNERMERHLRDLSGVEALREALLEDMPLDEERRNESLVWLSFIGHALTRPELTAEYRRSYERWHAMWAAVIRDMVLAGEASPAIDPEFEARTLVAFSDSVNIQAIMDPEFYTSERLLSMIDDFLARLERR